jgi:imidazolonepropionase
LTKTQVDLIIHRARQIVTVRGHNRSPAIGPEMEDLGLLEDASIAIKGEEIVSVGRSDAVMDQYSADEQIDATGRVVTPGFVDPHTHLVFAGSRESELELKIKGAGYLEILQKGGGILRTVRDTRAATKEDLLRICKQRSRNLLLHGTTTVESKSGYGLTLNDEIKMLEVIRELKNARGPTLVPTFLGAHAIPPEFEGRVADYATLICDEWIPEIAKRKLAVFCDVFCEKGVFEIQDSRRILESGKRVGLKPKIHADELYPLGGAELAAEVGAISADHLLYASAIGLAEMRRAGVIATLLPAAPLTLMMDRYVDARKIIAEHVPVALGSDLSPSCWIEDHQLVMALACYKLKMTPAEALVAATINAAHAIGKAQEIGSIEGGKKADIVILDTSDYRFLGYTLGSNMVNAVVKNGRVVVQNGQLAM